MRRILEHAKAHRLLAVLLCLCMVLPSLSGIGSIPRIVEAADASAKTPGASKYVADPNTMESYRDVLNLDVNSRNAGRLWTDKSVSVGDITLSETNDGVSETITNSSDFLHVFSVLGSSQEMIGVPPTRTVIVFDNSATMYESPKANNISGTRIGKTVEAINRAIDSLMAASQYNEVAVVLFGNGETDSSKEEIQKNTAVTILPMAHYAPNQQEITAKGYTSYINASWGILGASSSEQKSAGFVSVERKMLPETDADYAGSGTVSYANGTTNIDAGIYQGMKELLEVKKKTVTLGTETYQCVPAMVVLTDGSATDSLTGPFSNPVMDSYGLVNEPGNKFLSFIQNYYPATGSAAQNEKRWEMFVHFNDFSKRYEQIGWNEGQKEKPYQKEQPNEQWQEAMKDFADTYRSTHKYMLLHTLMMAAYHKAAVEKAYGDTALSVYSVSVDITSPATVIKDRKEDTITEESLNSGKDYITTNGPTMNPGMYFNKTWLKDAGYITKSDVTNATKLGWEDTVYNNKQLRDGGAVIDAPIKGYNTGSAIILGMTDAYDAYTEWEKGNSAGTFKYQSWSEIRGLMNKMKDPAPLTADLFEGHGGLLNDGEHELSDDNTTTHGNAYYARPVQDRSENFPHLTGKKTKDNPYGLTDEDVKKNINYIKRAYYAETAIEGADQIKSAFEEIITEINQPVFTPVGGKNDLDAEDAVTYMDPIGKYMEVKDVDSMVLFGQKYGEVKAAVFDYGFYSAHNGSGEFKEGWYSADGADYGGLDPITHSKNGVWDEGWTYYIGPDTARQFVSSIPETGKMEAEQNSKFRNTIYTIYRLDLEKDQRDKLRMNPAYGTDAELQTQIKNGTIQDTNPELDSYYTNFDGVYKLSDVRVWVEDTGNYNDTLVDSSGIMSGTGMTRRYLSTSRFRWCRSAR